MAWKLLQLLSVCCAFDMHESAWSAFEGIEEVLKNKGGVLAGTPLADILFTALVSMYVRRLQKVLESEGIKVNVDLSGAVTNPEALKVLNRIFPSQTDVSQFPSIHISFIDDLVLTVYACATQTIQVAERVIRRAHEIAKIFGLILNYSKGKTEILIRAFGAGKKALYDEIEFGMCNQLLVNYDEGSRLCPRYPPFPVPAAASARRGRASTPPAKALLR